MTQPPLHRLYHHYSEQPFSMRILYTAALCILGMGYLFAMIYLFHTYSGRDGNPMDLRGCIQSIKMLSQTKHGRTVFRLVAAHPFKHATAVMQRVRRHMRGGVAPGNDAAIHPDPFTFVKRHKSRSPRQFRVSGFEFRVQKIKHSPELLRIKVQGSKQRTRNSKLS